MKTVLQVCAFGAEYGGNFIASLEELERELSAAHVRTIYAFCEKAKDKKWCKDIENRTTVYYLPEARARILPKTYAIFRKIYAENKVDIVHTHFELYDMPATITAPRAVSVFWHLHDPIIVTKDIRSILWKIQYGIVGKRAKLLAVSDFYRREAIRVGFPENRSLVVLNGIDTKRLCPEAGVDDRKKTVDFLTLGWDFYRKGDDLIIEAGKQLEKEGYNFRLLLNGNETTWDILNSYTKGEHMDFLKKGNPTKNVSELYASASVFIQASRKETFSYAVCEAAYSGLPVICSDIAGLEWAHELPSVFFFDLKQPDKLYSLMKDFLNGRQIEDVELEKTRTIIEQNYTIQAWVRRIISIYGLEGA